MYQRRQFARRYHDGAGRQYRAEREKIGQLICEYLVVREPVAGGGNGECGGGVRERGDLGLGGEEIGEEEGVGVMSMGTWYRLSLAGGV